MDISEDVKPVAEFFVLLDDTLDTLQGDAGVTNWRGWSRARSSVEQGARIRGSRMFISAYLCTTRTNLPI
jgi:hypothetical protein